MRGNIYLFLNLKLTDPLKTQKKHTHIELCHTSHLARVLIGNPDHSWHSALLLNQVQTGSVGVRSVSQPIQPMEVSRVDADPEDGLSSTFKHGNLAQEKEEKIQMYHMGKCLIPQLLKLIFVN